MVVIKINLDDEHEISAGLQKIKDATKVRSNIEAMRLFFNLMMPSFEDKIDLVKNNSLVQSNNSNIVNLLDSMSSLSSVNSVNSFNAINPINSVHSSRMSTPEGGFDEEFDNLEPEY